MTHQTPTLHEVGRVAALYRYPVKSMRGEELVRAEIGWHGIPGDRRFAFVRGDDRSDFPWLTGRQIPALVRYVPSFVDPDKPRASVVSVCTPDGRVLPLDSNELLDELSQAYRGAPVSLLQVGRGIFDAANISLISTASVAAIATLAGVAAEARRFRPNIVVEMLAAEPFGEERWVGQALSFGDRPDAPRVHMQKRDERCMMINLNPETGQQDPAVLRTVVQLRDECAGIYGVVERTGAIQVGDVVRLTAK